MKRNSRMRRCRSRHVATLLVAGVALVATAVASAATREVTIAFNSATLPYPDGTILTTQLSDHYGIVFSADDSDLPPAYRLSLGPQENVVREGSELTNPFRIFFRAHTVTSVSLTIDDRNTNDQRHTLTAFNAAGAIVDMASAQDGVQGEVAGTFTLTVSTHSPKNGIAYVVEIEQPFGAEVLRELRYVRSGYSGD